MSYDDSTKDFVGEKIFCRHLKPSHGKDPKCLVFVCHGFGEHIGRYDEIFQLFSNEGMYVFGHDHVGHGKSTGHRAWVENYKAYSDPVKHHIEDTVTRFPGKKIFIFGHSMGGLITLNLLHQHPKLVDGFVLEAPFLGIPDDVPPWLVSLGMFLGSYRLTHGLPVSKIATSHITHDTAVVKDYENDPLVFHGAANARFVAESMAAKNAVFAHAKQVALPFLIAHGDADHICPISGSQKFFDESSSGDKTFKVFEEGYHQLRSENVNGIKESFLKLSVEWINARA